MKFLKATFALMAAAALAACANTAAGLRTNVAPTMGGSSSSYSSAAIRLEASPNAYFGALFLGAYVAAVGDDHLSWRYGPDGRKPPPLAEGRAIAERDCSRPIALPSANLRCK